MKNSCIGKRCAGKPCLKPDCECCSWWMKATGIGQTSDAEEKPSEVKELVKNLCKRAQKTDKLETKVKKLIETNRALNAKKNKIKTVTVNDPPKGGKKRGRPKGTKATKNYRPKNIDRVETVDDTTCPDCGGKLAGTISDTYDKVVTRVTIIKENVCYVRTRRWCCQCEKQVMQPIPGVKKYARRSSNHLATMTLLNMQGMSHAKTADVSKNVLKTDVSRQTAYRDKISHANWPAPLRDAIKENTEEGMSACRRVSPAHGRRQGIRINRAFR